MVDEEKLAENEIKKDIETLTRLYKRSLAQKLYTSPNLTSSQRDAIDIAINNLQNLSKEKVGPFSLELNLETDPTSLIFHCDNFDSDTFFFDLYTIERSLNQINDVFNSRFLDSIKLNAVSIRSIEKLDFNDWRDLLNKVEQDLEYKKKFMEKVRKALVIPINVFNREIPKSMKRLDAFEKRRKQVIEITTHLEQILGMKYPIKKGDTIRLPSGSGEIINVFSDANSCVVLKENRSYSMFNLDSIIRKLPDFKKDVNTKEFDNLLELTQTWKEKSSYYFDDLF